MSGEHGPDLPMDWMINSRIHGMVALVVGGGMCIAPIGSATPPPVG
jgi:hypothetical protein